MYMYVKNKSSVSEGHNVIELCLEYFRAAQTKLLLRDTLLTHNESWLRKRQILVPKCFFLAVVYFYIGVMYSGVKGA